MRILGKRNIQTVSGMETRPTASRVREAIFNTWQFDILNCRWLDICAGTGAMGAEALGRGAAFVGGIERSSKACRVVEQNWRKLADPTQQFQVWQGDVLSVLPDLAGQLFDRIYFDPPYASEIYEPVIEMIATYELLCPSGRLAVEHRKGHRLPAAVVNLSASGIRHYGNTAITFYQVSLVHSPDIL
jgi:16S rRNA (guanine(966)-N(2))-methyltransferase RsmD